MHEVATVVRQDVRVHARQTRGAVRLNREANQRETEVGHRQVRLRNNRRRRDRDERRLTNRCRQRVRSDDTVRIWNVQTRKMLHRLKGHTDTVNSVAYSPDGPMVASAGHEDMVRLWDAKTGELDATLSGHDGPVNALAFSHNGRLLATAGDDHVAKFWDLASDKEIAALKGHTDSLNDIAFSPDDATLAALLLGPTGNLKAPTILVGKTMIAGFNEAAYEKYLK